MAPTPLSPAPLPSRPPLRPAEVPWLTAEASLRFLRDGYAFGLRGFRDVGADAFRTRLFGRPAVVARGAEAVHVFGSGGFRRVGAIPRSVRHLLQDDGSVQTLEGPRHEARKALLLELARDDRGALVERFREEWIAGFEHAAGSRVSLLDLSSVVLTRAALRWVGVGAGASIADPALVSSAGDLRVMIDRAASVGPPNWAARLRRRRVEAWARSRIEAARADDDRRTVVGRLAHHREEGRELDAEVAAVELLNLLRPTVAVARFIAFAAHALHAHPEQAARLRDAGARADAGSDAGAGAGTTTTAPGTGEGRSATATADATRWFADEVRRFYPFFPMAAGVATEPFALAGTRFEAGRWMLLDLFGTDRSPELWTDPQSFDPSRFATASPRMIVAQGVGDPLGGHRCPGEQATSDLVAAAVRLLVDGPAYRVPEQDLRISLRRIPARPQDGMLVEIPGKAQ